MKLLDVISVGDAMADLFLTLEKNDEHITAHDDSIEFTLGDKIHVEKGKLTAGGIACNVSVGLSRLGENVGFIAELGSDSFSSSIIETLEKEHVDITLVVRGEKESSLAVGIQYAGDRVLFVEHVRRPHDFSFVDVSCKWVYLAGIGDVWQHAYTQTLSYISRTSAKLAFTPGSTQLHSDDKVMFDVLSQTEVLLLNKEEAEHILSLRNLSSSDMETIITHLLTIGPRIVSVTDGNNGSFAGSNEGNFHMDPFPAIVVEKTGAGDSYASGFLAAIMQGNDIKTAMRWGAANAASVVTKVGSQDGLLTKSQLQDILIKHQEGEPKEI